MDMKYMLKHLIVNEACFPALKLVLDKHYDLEDFGELPKLTPTHYLQEHRLSTEERHKLLCRQQRKISTRGAGMEVEVEPPIVVFQNYKFGETYTFPIVVRNISKNSQKVAILMDESFVFKFDECSQRVAKFPCGMCITAAITFTPENPMEDYYHKLVISTNTTKVVVPIIGIGPRPLLNAPDCVLFTDAPVRYWTIKSVNVLNIGKKPAKFSLVATGPFCVKPEKGVALPNEAFTFEVAYFSPSVATNEGEVCIKYENGEEIYVYLKGNAKNCDIKLSSPDVRCEDTYVTLRTRTTFYVENNSNVTAKFYWKNLPEYEDMMRFYGHCDECPHQWKDGEGLEDALEHGVSKPISYDLEPECKEILKAVRHKPDNLFTNDDFQIYPLFGEIKPNTKAEIQLIFSPTECAFYQSVAYLEINGLEQRLPFSFYGRGLGTKFKLGFEILNVGDVALGGTHTYEIPVQNISEVPGIIRCDGLIGAPSGMGIKVEPHLIHIAPDQYGAFYVMFTVTGRPGPFSDEIKFVGHDTGDTFYVTVTGTITYPSIRFASPETQLGKLSFGFPKTFYISLVNDSLNYVNVDLKMEQDGIDPPIDFNNILTSFKNDKFAFENDPAEFKIFPQKVTLKPRGVQKVQLTMYPNQIRPINNVLMCCIIDSEGNEVECVASTNIRGAVVVTTLHAVKDVVQLRDCYLHYPYSAEFVIQNTSELPVVFCIIQKPNQYFEIRTDHFIGVAEPWVETVIPFCVNCLVAGDVVTHLELFVVGNEDKMLTLTLKVEAIPSKVEGSTRVVDFGKIEVLDVKTCTYDIVNTSPIDFPFTAQLFYDEPLTRGEWWRLEPETGVLPSQSRITFIVYLLLKEVGWHHAGIRIQMNEPIKHTIEMKMKALGVGSPLVFTPPLDKHDVLDFGIIFIKQEKVLTYEIENKGINVRYIEWKPYGEKSPINKVEAKNNNKRPYGLGGAQQARASRTSPTTQTQASTPEEKKEVVKKYKSNFYITPMQAHINPGESIKMTIATHCANPKKLDEHWNLWTFVPAKKAGEVEEKQEKGDQPGPVITMAAQKNIKRVSNSSNASKQSKSSVTGMSTKGVRKQNEPPNLHFRPSVLSEVRLVAQFEPPGLKFSKRTINFLIEATPTHENFIAYENLKVENAGSLPLKVKFKTKLPFTFSFSTDSDSSHHDDTQHSEQLIDIGVKQVVYFKIKFDGQHLRKEAGRIIFEEKLDSVCTGVFDSDPVDLIGEVRFPELTLERYVIDFGNIPNSTEAVQLFTVTNNGNFCLTYKWYIKPGTTVIEKIPDTTWANGICTKEYRPSIGNNLKILDWGHAARSGGKRRSELRPLSTEPHHAQRASFSHTLGIRSEVASSYEDFSAFVKEKMYRSRMMEFMGLRDSIQEAEDEVNYLSFYNPTNNLPKEEFNTNELVDIIPLAGVVQAGQSQTFTAVFYGYPDIYFRTTLVLYVEGGARKNVEVRGSTGPPRTPELEPEPEPIFDGRAFSFSSKRSSGAGGAVSGGGAPTEEEIRRSLASSRFGSEDSEEMRKLSLLAKKLMEEKNLSLVEALQDEQVLALLEMQSIAQEEAKRMSIESEKLKLKQQQRPFEGRLEGRGNVFGGAVPPPRRRLPRLGSDDSCQRSRSEPELLPSACCASCTMVCFCPRCNYCML